MAEMDVTDGCILSCISANNDGDQENANGLKNERSFKLIDVRGDERDVTKLLLCVVNSSFKDKKITRKRSPTREGSEEDITKIEKVFKKFNFEISEENKVLDGSRKQILSKIETIGMASSNNNTEASSLEPDVFVLFVMSHGCRDGKIYTDFPKGASRRSSAKATVSSMEDFETYTTQDVFEAISSNKNIRNSLKIIVFQACRGGLQELLVSPTKEAENAERIVSEHSCRFPVLNTPKNSIVVYPTVEGTTSFRSCKDGSFLVQPLCCAIETAEHGREILEVITRAQSSICDTPVQYGGSESVQTPEIVYNAREQLVVHLQSHCQDDIQSESLFPTISASATISGDYYAWGNSEKEGHAVIIKMVDNFDESQLKQAISGNLEVFVEVYKPEQLHQGADKVFKEVLEKSSKASYLLAVVVAKLIVSTISKQNLPEVCLDTDPPMPIRDIMCKYVGTNNLNMAGRPRFFIFIDNDELLAGSRIPFQCQILEDSSGEMPPVDLSFPNHSYNLTHICIGKEDLANLISHLADPKLHNEGCSLQSQLAQCIRLSYKENIISEIHTLFASTIPKLVNFPYRKDAYIWPSISQAGIPDEFFGEKKYNLKKELVKMIEDFISKKLLRNKLTSVYFAWILVAPTGQGKSRFTYELARQLEFHHKCQVIRVKLRNLGKFLDSCEINPDYVKQYKRVLMEHCKIRSLLPDKKLVFLLDGFEKVSRHFKNSLNGLFKEIKGDHHPMLLTTRPNALADFDKHVVSQYKVWELPSFVESSRIDFLKQNLILREKDCAPYLEVLNLTGINFGGNPENVKIFLEICSSNPHKDKIFQIFQSVLHSKIEKALIKFESISKLDSRLKSRARTRRNLMVVAFAQLEKIDFVDDNLTKVQIAQVNNVGVVQIDLQHTGASTLTYHFKFFKYFLFVLYTVHKVGLGKLLEVDLLEIICEHFSDPEEIQKCFDFFDSFKAYNMELPDLVSDYDYVIDVENLDH